MKKIFNFIVGLLIIFAILYFCKILLQLLKISFPPTILGIIVLFFLLKSKIIKEELIEDFCQFILKYMILFFIPIFVGTMNYCDIISQNILAILATLFITTTLVIVTVGLFAYNAIKFQRLHNQKRSKK